MSGSQRRNPQRMSRRTRPVPRNLLAATTAPRNPTQRLTRPQTTTQAGGTVRRSSSVKSWEWPLSAATTTSTTSADELAGDGIP